MTVAVVTRQRGFNALIRGLVALAPVAMACGGDGGTPPPARSISLTASPAALSIPLGGAGTVNVTLVRAGGFDGPVNVAVSGLPVGVTSEVTPSLLTVASGQAQVVLTVAGTATPGTHSATISASANGVSTASATVSIVVTQPPGYELSVTPGSLLVNAGAAGQVTVNVDRANFGSAVALALVNPPNGITGSFAATPTTGSSASLTISVAGTVSAGTRTLTIGGTADGLSRTTTMTLSVAPAPSYLFSLTPSYVPMEAGATRHLLAVIDRVNFTGAVSLSLRNPPVGISGQFAPPSTTGGHGSFIVTVDSNVALGTYPLTVVGTATGVPDKLRDINVQVIAPSVPPPPSSNDFSFAVTSSVVSAPPGGSTSNSIILNRFSGTADITFSLESAPPGVTAVFAPVALSGATMFAALQIQVASSVAPGSYQLIVRASAPGFTKTDTFTLGVYTQSAFTLRPTIPSFTLFPNSNLFLTISVVRQNFTGPVMLQLEKVPPGMTISGLPLETTLNAAEFGLSISQPPPGTHTLTVRGSSPGQADQTTTIQIIIPEGSFTIRATPFQINAYPGETVTSTITTTRTNWPHDIVLRIDPEFGSETLPSLSSTVLNGSTATSTLTMHAPDPDDQGFHQVVVRVASNGADIFSLIVNVYVAWRRFIFLDLSGSVSIPAGTSSAIPISAQRNNYDGPFTLSVIGQPSGMTVAFSPNPVTGNTSSMTVNVGAGVPPGNYTLTVSAVAAGVRPETRMITIQVP